MTIMVGMPAGIAVAEAWRRMAALFDRNGIAEATADARILLAHALGLNRTELAIQGRRTLEACELERIGQLAARRLRGEPVARILGQREFWSLPLTVAPAVLVPRPETETVVEAALDHIEREGLKRAQLRLLDMGTGSGALLLALLSELPNATGIGTDISIGAVACARANAARNGLAARCDFVVADFAAGLRGSFDLIVSNPPYVARGDIDKLPREIKDYDPLLALDGGRDGLDAFRAIAAMAPSLLAPRGCLAVEMGAGQESAVRGLFNTMGLKVSEVRADLAQIPRALVAIRA